MTFNFLAIICSGIVGGNRVDVFKNLYYGFKLFTRFLIEPVAYQHLITQKKFFNRTCKNLQIKKVNTPFNHLQRDARQFYYKIEEVEKDFNKMF